MLASVKNSIKGVFRALGIIHPSGGVKIGQEEKAQIILDHKTSSVHILVETGTSQGWMVDKIGDQFEKVYSIELDRTLYQKALTRFANKNNVTLLQGDSGIEIKKVLEKIAEPALFWLDAHPEGPINTTNSPIIEELKAILSHSVKNQIILIDDARHFDRRSISAVKELASAHNYTCIIERGVFRLYGK